MREGLVFTFLVGLLVCLASCKQQGKSRIEQADAVNQAILDTSASSSSLVSISDALQDEINLAGIVKHQGVVGSVKDLASNIYLEYSEIMDSLVRLSNRKNIVLPVVNYRDTNGQMIDLEAARGKQLDKLYLGFSIINQEKLIKRFEEIMLEAKDEDIRSFAELTMYLVKKYINEARALQKAF